MKKFTLFLTLISFQILSISVFSQTIEPKAPPAIEEDGDIVKINSSIIQMDVLVTDKKGNQISDLKPEDFEVYENGKRQQIIGVSYISVSPKADPKVDNNKNKIPNDLENSPFPTTTKPLERGNVRRTIVLVVDDLSLSFTSFDKVRDALKEFVEDQMQEGDLVAILRTAGGRGSRQVFTSDKKILLQIVKDMKFTSIIGKTTGIEQIRPATTDFEGNSVLDQSGGNTDLLTQLDNDTTTLSREQPTIPTDNPERITSSGVLKESFFARGTLGTLQYVVNGLEKLPGRKAVMLFSDGFSISRRDSRGRQFYDNTVSDYLKRLSEIANRAGVVFYTIDGRGLEPPAGIAQAADNFFGNNRSASLAVRDRKYVDSQEGLVKLAQDTGGRSLINSNSFNTRMQVMLDEQNGYYILAYEPDEETFDPKKSRYNNIEVKVKRSNTKVRYRSGFFGIADGQKAPTDLSPREQILDALNSPFSEADINLKLNPLFGNSSADGSFVRSLIHIKSGDISFVDDGNDWKKASFDIVAITYGDAGKPIDQSFKTYSFKIKNEDFPRIQEKGFVYNVFLPVKEAGAYQFRLVIRDNETGRIGSANQFIQIPDIKKKDLILSSIIVENYTPQEWQDYLSNNLDEEKSKTGILADTANKQFKNSSILRYNFEIYNAKLNNKNAPQVQTKARLFKDGKPVMTGNPQKINLGKEADPTRIDINGAVALGRDLLPGDYILQILVYDELADKKKAIATQVFEFEIVE